MDKQETWKHTLSPLHAIAAVTDFAQLSQQASTLLSSSLEPSEFISRLLVRLISLCQASQGAFLLAFPSHHLDPRLLATTSFADTRLSPLVVRHRMSEEAMLVALSRYSPDGPDIQVPANIPSLLLWRRIIDTFPREGVRQPPLLPTTDGSSSASSLDSYSSIQVLFLLYWNEDRGAAQGINEGKELLPLAAEAVDAVIINLMLALRVQDLEQSTYRQAEQQTELFKSELLATVSHELRGPLASMKGYASTLLRHDARLLREERHEFLMAMSSATARLETTVDRLLEISQLETKTVPFAPSAVNLARLAQEALNARIIPGSETTLQTKEAVQQSVTYTLHTEPDDEGIASDEFTVQGDRRLLRTLLDHLLENATLHSPPQSTIEIGLRALSDPFILKAPEEQLHQRKPAMSVLPSLYRGGPLVEIWVKDHGSGIAREHLTRIFDRFYRVDMSLTREINGLGLGLTICKNIVDLHEGTIWVESEVGKGSTFHVLIPQGTHRSTAENIL